MSTEKSTTPADAINAADADAAQGAGDDRTAAGVREAESSHHPDDVIAALRVDLVRARDEATDLKDRWVRSQAELDNIRKRAEREKADTARYAISKFAQDMVNVGDNFERALAALPQEAIAQDGVVKSVLEGVSMIEREFHNALGRHGIKRTEPQGQPFDPSQQQAVMEIEDASVPAGTVVRVFQPGYLIEGRVLRHAVVVVAKGGPKAQPASAAAEPGATPEPVQNGGSGSGEAPEHGGTV